MCLHCSSHRCYVYVCVCATLPARCACVSLEYTPSADSIRVRLVWIIYRKHKTGNSKSGLSRKWDFQIRNALPREAKLANTFTHSLISSIDRNDWAAFLRPDEMCFLTLSLLLLLLVQWYCLKLNLESSKNIHTSMYYVHTFVKLLRHWVRLCLIPLPSF